MKSKKTNKCKKFKIDFLRLGIISISIYFVLTFIKQQFEINEYNIQKKYYKNEIETREKKIKIIQSTIENVDTPDYKEKVAREELGLVKPYEKIFIDTNK